MARKEYRRMAKELVAAGMVTRLDRAVLVGYAISYARTLEAEAEIARSGSIVRSARTGGAIVSPFQLLQSMSLNALKNFAAELGASPSSRGRVHAVEQPQAMDPFDKWLAGGRAALDDDDDEVMQ